MSNTPRSDAFLREHPDLMPDGGFLFNLEVDMREFEGRVKTESANQLEASRKKGLAFAAILAERKITKYNRSSHCAACSAADNAAIGAIADLIDELRKRAEEYANWHPGFTDVRFR
jgi:hypothetical protein